MCDYALDLKNFHEGSHHRTVAPILVATATEGATLDIGYTPHNDRLLRPIRSSAAQLGDVFRRVLEFGQGPSIAVEEWETSRYCPTPTIVEAAMALYRGHSVAEISRSDAGAINLSQTARAVSDIIARARSESHKAICFVTGVPGAGKTLIGLNIATEYIDRDSDLYSVFLSGNGPLVAILAERSLAIKCCENVKLAGASERAKPQVR